MSCESCLKLEKLVKLYSKELKIIERDLKKTRKFSHDELAYLRGQQVIVKKILTELLEQ